MPSLQDKIRNLLPSRGRKQRVQQQQQRQYDPDEVGVLGDSFFEHEPQHPQYPGSEPGGLQQNHRHITAEGNIKREDGHFNMPADIRRDVVDPSLMQQPAYDDNQAQVLNDMAADESLPVLSYYITQLARIGNKAQARLVTRAAAFQSKNQVFSNIVDVRDYQMAQDDYAYVGLLSQADFTCFDMNTDYFTAIGIMEAMFNIRLRRSRKALNLLQANTQRQESIMAGGGQQQQQEDRGIWGKIPLLGGGGNRNQGGGGGY